MKVWRVPVCGAWMAMLLLGPALRADGQADLRNALARLTPQGSLKATAEFRIWRNTGTEKQPKILQGHLQATVEDGPTGLRLTWPVAVLNQARQEARLQAQNPEAPDPVRTAMRELDALQVRTCLDAAEDLLRDLDQAKFLEERVEAWQDKPARLLSFRLEPKLSEDTKKALKKLDATLKLWIAPDGTPLASSSSVYFKASKMLISIESTQKEERSFTTQGNRLVIQSQTQEETSSAMGDRSQTKKVLNLALN